MNNFLLHLIFYINLANALLGPSVNLRPRHHRRHRHSLSPRVIAPSPSKDQGNFMKLGIRLLFLGSGGVIKIISQ